MVGERAKPNGLLALGPCLLLLLTDQFRETLSQLCFFI